MRKRDLRDKTRPPLIGHMISVCFRNLTTSIGGARTLCKQTPEQYVKRHYLTQRT